MISGDGDLSIRGVSKTFPGSGTVLDRIDLTVPAGSSLALLGPSGCGKTTLLRIVAGLMEPDAGSVSVGERILTDGRTIVPADKRRVGMVFQNWALFSHLDVARNVGFGLARGERKKSERIDEVLDMVDMTEFAGRSTESLSGGQQQRVALARALAPRPGVLLLDEPFSNLDATLRTVLRREVRTLLTELGVTSIFVTHDQEEAFILGDRLGIMNAGSIVQVGTPVQIYERPVDRWVASFVGEANFVRARATGDGSAITDLGPVRLTGAQERSGPIDVLVRPEQLCLHHTAPDAPHDPHNVIDDSTGGSSGAVSMTVTSVEYLGHSTRISLDHDGDRLVARESGRPRFKSGDEAVVTLGDEPLCAFAPDRVEQQIR